MPNWEVAAITLAVIFVAVFVIQRWLIVKLRNRAGRSIAKWDDTVLDLLASLRLWLLVPILVFAALRTLATPPWLDRGVQIVAIVCIGIQSLITLRVLIDAGLEYLVRRTQRDLEPNPGLASSLTVIRVLALGVLGVLIVLAALDNMGVSVTPLITGLGIGGVAVALAVQNILGDLFSSLSIILDKPFVVGDYIVAGKEQGTVEQIGIKTTRVRSLSGEQLVFANSDLLDSRIQNFKRMQERRIEFTFLVPYDLPPDRLEEIPPMVEAAVRSYEKTRFDRCHLKSLGEFALTFECVYFVRSPSFNEYMDIQQGINLRLLREFQQKELSFAARPIAAIPGVKPGSDGKNAQVMVVNPWLRRSPGSDSPPGT